MAKLLGVVSCANTRRLLFRFVVSRLCGGYNSRPSHEKRSTTRQGSRCYRDYYLFISELSEVDDKVNLKCQWFYTELEKDERAVAS